MKKSIVISIPEPCHENWSEMTSTEKGKFCGVCTKEVIDFTQTSDEEIVKKISNGVNLCGRFKKSQLDREVKMERASKYKLMPYAASLLMPLTILSTTASTAVNDGSAFNKPAISLGIGSNSNKSIVEVSGYITDANGNPIAQAEILVLETGASVWSESDGSYTLKCASGSTLVFQKEQMKPHEVKVGAKHLVVQVMLEDDYIHDYEVMGDIAPPIEVITKLQGLVGKIKVQEEKEISHEKKDSTRITLSGTISDESGLPLPGVNIVEKGTNRGTQTDFDGNYILEVTSNSKLIFSYIGYYEDEKSVSNISNEISFQMHPMEEMLVGEMIVCRFPAANEVYSDPLSREAELDHDQIEKKHDRKSYAKKVNAFIQVQQDRIKAKRRARRKKK
jgi:hypothetical protein